MTKNVFDALNFINREGLDNSQWGLETGKHEVSLAEMFPINRETWSSVSCPQSFLWIWVNLETADQLFRLNLKPTWMLYSRHCNSAQDDEEFDEAIFIWELRAED